MENDHGNNIQPPADVPPTALIAAPSFIWQRRSEWLRDLDQFGTNVAPLLNPQDDESSWSDLHSCGRKVAVRVCAKCGREDLETGTLTEVPRLLCGQIGCPVCDAEDRSLRRESLSIFLHDNAAAVRQMRNYGNSQLRKLQRYARKRAAATNRYVHPDKRRGIGDDIKFADKAVTFGIEITHPVAEPVHLKPYMHKLRRALKHLSKAALNLATKYGVSPKRNFEPGSMAWWIEPNHAANAARLRMLMHGTRPKHYDVVGDLRRISSGLNLNLLEDIELKQASCWVDFFAGVDHHRSEPEAFVQSWFRGKSSFVLESSVAAMWAMAGRHTSAMTSQALGIVERYYQPVGRNPIETRHHGGKCPHCRRDAKFRERLRPTRNYVGACRWQGVKPFGVRALPARDVDEPEMCDD